MDLAGRVADLIQPSLEAMGYDLVRVQVIGRQRPRLQIMAERHDDVGMTVDDCATLSRAVSAILDVEDPIAGAYTLEVSSPGIDRPLVRLADFERFAGLDARVELGRLIDGRRRFQGRLAGTDGSTVRLAVDGATIGIPFADIVRAKLVLTDELLAAAGAGSG
jgi:ribosome maturation factor RimP